MKQSEFFMLMAMTIIGPRMSEPLWMWAAAGYFVLSWVSVWRGK